MTRTQKTILFILGASALVVVVFAVLVVVQTARPMYPEVTATALPLTTGTATLVPVFTDAPAADAQNPTPTSQPAQLTHTVQSGDTLSSIASQYGVTIENLYNWNQLTSDIIQPGWTLTVSPPMISSATTVSATMAIGMGASEPAATSQPGQEIGEHWVSVEDTLETIASRYQVSVANLRAANHMVGDALLPGQKLIIPSGAVASNPFQFAILEGDIYSAYPQTYEMDQFTLHTAPDTYPAINQERLAAMELEALQHVESIFQSNLSEHFDVFVAGSVFAPPNRALRGRSFSLNLETLYLHDGSGNAADQQYIATHELTHLYTWNTFGAPVSVMLSEGAAVYSGMQAIRGQGHLPLETFCAAYQQAGQLPRVSGSLSFEGHILDLQNYYAAGCFAGYLIEVYGAYSFGQLYPSGDFESVYGKNASDLEDEWRRVLAMEVLPAGLSPERLVSEVSRLERTYLNFFSGFSGNEIQMTAYRELDLARLALLSGDLDKFDEQLILYETALQAP